MNREMLAARVSGRPLLLAPQGADLIGAMLARRGEERSWLGRLIGSFRRAEDDERDRPTKPSAWTPPYLRGRSTIRQSGLLVAEGIAVLDVRGPLMDRALTWWDGDVWVDGYDRLIAAFDEARIDEQIRGLMVRFDTPGGMVDGLDACARSLRRVSEAGKPVVGYVGSAALSAGYWLAAGCDRIVATPEGLAGSIGVVIMHVEYSRMLEEAGIAVTPIKFGQKKTDGSPLEKLSETASTDMQAMVDDLGGRFVAHVAGRRGVTEEAVIATQAGVLMARPAMALGLVDEIAFEEDAFAALLAETRGESPGAPAPAGAS